MREGEVVSPGPGEEVKCLRSGADGGPFVFEFTLGPKGKGPPEHSHDEGDEIIEVLSGEIVFRVNGKATTLKPGDVLTVGSEDVHTFWNPSKDTPVVCKVTHGARFERAIEQPSFPAMAVYITFVDPGSSRIASPVIRGVLRVVATFARLLGVKPTPGSQGHVA